MILFFLIFVFLPIHSSNAMPELAHSRIINTATVTRNTPLAIACTAQGTLVVLDKQHCVFSDYQNSRISQVRKIALDQNKILTNRIYVHPKIDITVIPSSRDYGFMIFNNVDVKQTETFYMSNQLNIAMSDFGNVFYRFEGNMVLTCSSHSRGQDIDQSISPGFVFKISANGFSALFCDRKRKSMYEMLDRKVGKKLFDFKVKLDFSHWVYNAVSECLYTITRKERKLYIANTKTLKETIVPLPCFKKIGTLELLTNKRVLALLSQCRSKMCYFDLKTLQPLLITTHDVSRKDRKSVVRGQKIAINPNGEDIIIALSDACLVIKIPAWIREIDTYEKYRIIQSINLVQDARWVITRFFYTLIQKQ